MSEQEKEYWFKPKSHGYGAAPTHWKGWALVLAFVIWTLAITAIFVVFPSMSGEDFNITNFLTWIALLGASVIGLVVISHNKTDGEWRWRWGGKS